MICGETVPASDLGVSVSGIVGDDQYRRIGDLDRSLREEGKYAFAGWRINRAYTREETEKAELFLIKFRYKHAAGEEFGTWYTDDRLNPDCGIERKQIKILTVSPFRTTLAATKKLRCALSSKRVGPLQIPHSELMRSHDIFGLWGGETVISGHLAELIELGGFSGGKLLQISNTQRGSRSFRDLSDVPSGMELLRLAMEKGLKTSDRLYWQWLEEPGQLPLLENALWEQKALWESRRTRKSPDRNFKELTVQSAPLAVSGNVVFGDAPFRKPSELCKCQFGEIRGQLLSALSVGAFSWDGSDICQTDLFFGGRRGLFRPHRCLVVSSKLFKAMHKAGMKGFDFEIAEMVS
jgi:hypothetical protein